MFRLMVFAIFMIAVAFYATQMGATAPAATDVAPESPSGTWAILNGAPLDVEPSLIEEHCRQRNSGNEFGLAWCMSVASIGLQNAGRMDSQGNLVPSGQ